MSEDSIFAFRAVIGLLLLAIIFLFISSIANAGERQYPAPIVMSHPSGCPARLFCGCGAAVRLGKGPMRSLWTARAWYNFPRAAAAPGRAAVSNHHVLVLEQHIEGNTWLVYDANAGRHLTLLHARSISGYTIVDPRT